MRATRWPERRHSRRCTLCFNARAASCARQRREAFLPAIRQKQALRTSLAQVLRASLLVSYSATSPRTNYRNPVVLRFTGSAGSGCRHGLQRPWLVAPGRPARGEAKNWRGKSARRAAALDSKGLPAGPRTRPRGPQHSPRSPARAHRAGREGPCQISRPTARFSPETASRRETRTTHRPTSHGPLPLLLVSDRRRPCGR